MTERRVSRRQLWSWIDRDAVELGEAHPSTLAAIGQLDSIDRGMLASEGRR